MAKKNAVEICLSAFVFIYVIQENMTVGGAEVLHTTALKRSTTLPIARQQVQFRRASCNCSGTACECTVRVNIVQINFNQLASIRIYYNPADVSLNLDVLLNRRVIYHTALSARNPPPFCMAVPQLPVVMLCVRLYDIRLGNNSIRACVNFEVQLVNNPILVVSFDCIRVGAGGVGIEKPSPAALVESPDPVMAANDTDVLAYIGSDKPVNILDSLPLNSELTTNSATSKVSINKNTLAATLSIKDNKNYTVLNEQTTETLSPVTPIPSTTVTLLTTIMPQESSSNMKNSAMYETTTYTNDLSAEQLTEENTSLYTIQISGKTVIPPVLPKAGSSENELTTKQMSALTTIRPCEIQKPLSLDQKGTIESDQSIANTFITATDNIRHTAPVTSVIDNIISKIKTLTTLADSYNTMAPNNTSD